MTGLGPTNPLPNRSSEEQKAYRREMERKYREANKDALNSKRRLRRLENLEVEREKDRKRYYEKNGAGRKREYYNQWRKRNPEEYYLYQYTAAMWRKYKRTPEDYERVLAEQGGGCANCGREPRDVMPSGRVRKLAWDHDHLCCPEEVTCGNCIRGLLCTRCNLEMGKLEAGYFDKHVSYLEKWLPTDD